MCKKIRLDESTTKLKISYTVDPKRPLYILGDEEIFGYLMEVNKDKYKSILHVKLIKDV